MIFSVPSIIIAWRIERCCIAVIVYNAFIACLLCVYIDQIDAFTCTSLKDDSMPALIKQTKQRLMLHQAVNSVTS